MSQVQSLDEELVKLQKAHDEKVEAARREWVVKDKLLTVCQRKPKQIYFYRHNDTVSVRYGTDHIYTSIDKPEEIFPTLDDMRALATLGETMPRLYHKDGSTSLAPLEIQRESRARLAAKQGEDRVAAIDEDNLIGPVILEVDAEHMSLSVKWYAKLDLSPLKAQRVAFEFEWPLYTLREYGIKSPGDVQKKARLAAGRHFVEWEYVRFSENKTGLNSLVHANGEAHLQSAIKWASGSEKTANRFTLYWQRIDSGGNDFTAADVADKLDVNKKDPYQ